MRGGVTIYIYMGECPMNCLLISSMFVFPLRRKTSTVTAPCQSKPGGSSGLRPPAGQVPADPSFQTASPGLLQLTLASPGHQGLWPAMAGSLGGPSWLALAGWQMGFLLGSIWNSICGSALGAKILHFHCIYGVFAHGTGRFTEEKTVTKWVRLRRKKKFKSASNSTWVTG